MAAPKLPGESALIPAPPRRFLSIGEAAAIVERSESCLKNWAKRIPGLGFKQVGRWAIRERNLVFLNDHGIERYLERYEVEQARAVRPPQSPNPTISPVTPRSGPA